jgi:hypothetical protein
MVMTETEELYEVTVGCWWTKRKEIFEWAVKTFGDRVEPHETLPILYFRNKADVAFFMLRWS